MRHNLCKTTEGNKKNSTLVSCSKGLKAILSAWIILFLVSAEVNGSTDPTFAINIPSMPLFAALTRLSEQTDSDVLFSFEMVDGKISKAINGRYSLLDALDVILQNTGLTGGLSEKGVVTLNVQPLTITRIQIRSASPQSVEEGAS